MHQHGARLVMGQFFTFEKLRLKNISCVVVRPSSVLPPLPSPIFSRIAFASFRFFLHHFIVTHRVYDSGSVSIRFLSTNLLGLSCVCVRVRAFHLPSNGTDVRAYAFDFLLLVAAARFR